MTQAKKGYIRGVKGFVITPLEADGSVPYPEEDSYGVKTAQQVGVSVISEGGAATTLRGGDKLLAYVKDHDTIVGADLNFQNARFDAEAIVALAGGTLIEEGEVTVGWEAPSIEDQQDPPYFKLEIYAQNHGARGKLDGFVKYTFAYGRSTFGNETLQDQTWVVPEMKMECFENPNSESGGIYSKEFVAELPALLTS